MPLHVDCSRARLVPAIGTCSSLGALKPLTGEPSIGASDAEICGQNELLPQKIATEAAAAATTATPSPASRTVEALD